MAKQRRIFTVTTPLGYRVTLTRDRWHQIIRFKHPAINNHQGDVKKCLQSPDVVRASAKDPSVHVYYRKMGSRYVTTVVAGDGDADRFVVTAYFTRRVKKGDELWKN